MKTTARRSTATKARKPTPVSPAKRAAPVRTANHEKAIREYEEALKLFSRKEYAKAAHLFETVVKDYPTEREVCDRSRMYASICKGRTGGGGSRPKEAEEFYYQGVMAANDGRLDEAAEMFEKVLGKDPQSDKALYALASVCSLRNDRAGAISNLQKAIAISAANRVQALNDPDFDPLREDAEFMALLGKAAERIA